MAARGLIERSTLAIGSRIVPVIRNFISRDEMKSRDLVDLRGAARDFSATLGEPGQDHLAALGDPLVVIDDDLEVEPPVEMHRAGGVDLGERPDERQVIDVDLLIRDGAVEVAVIEDTALPSSRATG